jgi:hypothetical protein
MKITLHLKVTFLSQEVVCSLGLAVTEESANEGGEGGCRERVETGRCGGGGCSVSHKAWQISLYPHSRNFRHTMDKDANMAKVAA